jgi:hypothetical protein
MFRSTLPLLLLVLLCFFGNAIAFSTTRQESSFRQVRTTGDSSRPYSMSSVEAPTREDIDRQTRRRQGDEDLIGDKKENIEDELRTKGPMEWLEDSMESREMDDPFHILLLGQTFEKEKITVPYVSSTLQYVLEMPADEATELSQFSFENGMSCLGTWPREECLSLGRQLQVRDIVCRVVPYCEGGHRGWQAKDADSAGFSDAGDLN